MAVDRPWTKLAGAVLEAVRDGSEGAGAHAQALARAVVERQEVRLANAVLAGGRFSLDAAVELAEMLLPDVGEGRPAGEG